MSIASPWLPYYRPKPEARLRLFCLPYAGGGASIFQSWRQQLPPGVELCAIQLPGRENRVSEAAFTRAEPLVATLAEELRPLLDKPFALFGHSMGARIGFELARRFENDGIDAAHLFASAGVAPQLPRDKKPIHELEDREFAEELRRLNSVPEAVLENTELREIFFPVLRADFAIVETYRHTPGEPLSCPIAVFGGLEDDGVTREQLEGWKEQTRGAFTLRMFPGDHFFLQSQRGPLLRMLSRFLTPIVSRPAQDGAR